MRLRTQFLLKFIIMPTDFTIKRLLIYSCYKTKNFIKNSKRRLLVTPRNQLYCL